MMAYLYEKIGNISFPHSKIEKALMKKSVLVCVLVQFSLFFCFLFYYYVTNTPHKFVELESYQRKLIQSNSTNNISCYDEKIDSLDYLPELDVGGVKNNSIFFIETRCHKLPADILTKRQACAVESAAATNPNMTVYVLFPSTTPFSHDDAPSYIQQLLEYPNVRLRHIFMEEYMRGTPLESWYGRGDLKKSDFKLVHVSDVLRLLTLWKFGGIYLDLDTVTLKSLKNLVPFAAIANEEFIGNAALGSPTSGIGHQVLTNALDEIKENFRGDIWGFNGPVLITNLLRKECKLEQEQSITEMNKDRCNGFNIHPPQYFYPHPYYQWDKYFSNGTDTEETMMALQQSYVVHMWNKMSSGRPVIAESKQPYSRLAKQFCPRVYSHAGPEF